MQNYNILPVLEEQDFKDKKTRQLGVIEKYQYFNKNKTNDLTDCARYLEFGLYQHTKDETYQKKLEKMFTCKDRFCPMCNWRRARKLGKQTYDVLEAIQKDHKVRYLFVTFTDKNVSIQELSEKIKHMNKSFERLFRSKRVKNSVLGWSRILEYPPQKNDASKINQHYHCLIVVPTSYFKTTDNLYIKQDEWSSLWQKALRVSYSVSVDVRIIKSKDGKDPIAKAVAEFAKYPLKDVDLKALSIEQFQELVKQMVRKRAVAFGGIMKEYRKKLILDDVEDGDLIFDDDELTEEEWQKVADIIYQFKMGEFGLDYYYKEIQK